MSRKLRSRPEKGTLSLQAFGEELLQRARQERPDAAIQLIGSSFLLVEIDPGQPRVVPLVSLYRNYCATPGALDVLVADFLANCVHDLPPTISGDFAANRARILPQIVPASLVRFSRRDGQPVAVMPFVDRLSIAFVVDEPERYCYISRDVMTDWRVTETDLLTVALVNLRALSVQAPFQQIGEGERAMLAFENFDGYDASRILLSRLMAEVSAHVPGQPVIAIPHRDSLLVIGDVDRSFVEAVGASVRRDFESHSYSITPNLLTLRHGQIVLYEFGPTEREVN